MADLKEIKFDINKLVHYSLDFDDLKEAIQWLMDGMQAQNKLLDRIDKDVRSRTYIIDK